MNIRQINFENHRQMHQYIANIGFQYKFGTIYDHIQIEIGTLVDSLIEEEQLQQLNVMTLKILRDKYQYYFPSMYMKIIRKKAFFICSLKYHHSNRLYAESEQYYILLLDKVLQKLYKDIKSAI